MRVLHTVQSLSKEATGVFCFLNDLTERQRELGCEATVVGCLEPSSALDARLWKHARTEFVRPLPLHFLRIATGLQEIVSRVKPDLVHCHGLWTYHTMTVPRLCKERKIPFLVSPHGMLEPWAWQQRAWKKRPFWWLWEKRFLQQASLIHATADQEVQNLRKLGLRNPMAMVPPGVDVPPERQKSEVRGQRSGVRTALFISRIHPKKGLLALVRAWDLVRPEGWRMVIAGPDLNGHQAVVRQVVQAAGLANCFDFIGPVYDAAKWSLYQSADLFVLPTYSENFGIVIAEALAAGVPVITTKGAPWAELTTRQCGWWVDIGVEPLAEALRKATALTDSERQQIGQRGRLLVEEKYAWPKIARDLIAAYEWVLDDGVGNPPSCVTLGKT